MLRRLPTFGESRGCDDRRGAKWGQSRVTVPSDCPLALRIVYNSATGQIFFDADGSGAGAQVLFATVNAGTVLSLADFVVI
jgi:hypothetical protein